MPHIIIECTDDLETTCGSAELIEAVFNSVEQSGLFDVANIKLRVIPLKVYKTANQNGFIHVQARVHQGRSKEQKQQLTAAIVAAITPFMTTTVIITAEVVDMDTASYAKQVTGLKID